MGAVEWALLLLLSLLWGGAFFFSKIALQELAPFTVVLFRVAGAAVLLGVYLRLTGQPIPRTLTVWAAFFGMGLINNLIPFSLLFWSVTVIPSGLASILNATTPVFAILVAHVLTTDEKMTPNKIAGVLLSIVGVVVLIGHDALVVGSHQVLAMLACLGAAVSYGFASVFGRRFRRLGIAPGVVAFGQVTCTTVMTAPLVVLVDRPWLLPAPGALTWVSLLALAVFSTALGYALFFRILEAGGATNASLVTLLVPVSAILLGSVFLGERLAANHFAGMALIAMGLMAIDGRLWRRLRGTPATP
jgi:drug/metabolite transporter (DMT)-like permease